MSHFKPHPILFLCAGASHLWVNTLIACNKKPITHAFPCNNPVMSHGLTTYIPTGASHLRVNILVHVACNSVTITP